MAIDLRTMYIQNAHRLSLYELKADIRNNRGAEVHAGQLFELDANGYWTYATGKKKAYPTLNNRYGLTATQGLQYELVEGRDDVTRSGKLAVLKGNFEIATDQYDKQPSYTPGDALVAFDDVAAATVYKNNTTGALQYFASAPSTGFTALYTAPEIAALTNKGQLTKFVEGAHKVQNIIGYVTQKPDSTQPELTTGMSANYTNPNVATYLRYEG
jgi:hypothetical protein